MHIQHAVTNQFGQLTAVLQQLSMQQFTAPCNCLFNATIGQHVRHIIELFLTLHQGYPAGIVNYDSRRRELKLETDLHYACETLQEIHRQLDKPDKPLKLQVDVIENTTEAMFIETNYHRELLYNLEHTVHHMALIRVGLKEVAVLELPESFGISSATLKHRKACAQ